MLWLLELLMCDSVSSLISSNSILEMIDLWMSIKVYGWSSSEDVDIYSISASFGGVFIILL